MWDIASMGQRPKKFIPLLAKRHNVSEATLWRDWSRRRSWLPKLARISENMHLLAEELTRIKRLKNQAYRMARDLDSKPHNRRLSMLTYKSLVELDFGLRGIAPMVQPEIILPEERVNIQIRHDADWFYDMMKSVSPRLAHEWVERASRMPESLERELEEEAERYQEMLRSGV